MTIDPALASRSVTPRWITRRSVPPLQALTRELAAVAAGRTAPELALTGARLLEGLEPWVRRGRIAAMRPEGTAGTAGLPPCG